MTYEYDEKAVNELLGGEPEDSVKRKGFDILFKSVGRTTETTFKIAELMSLHFPIHNRGEFVKQFAYNVAVCLIMNAGYDKEHLDKVIKDALEQEKNIQEQRKLRKNEDIN